MASSYARLGRNEVLEATIDVSFAMGSARQFIGIVYEWDILVRTTFLFYFIFLNDERSHAGPLRTAPVHSVCSLHTYVRRYVRTRI